MYPNCCLRFFDNGLKDELNNTAQWYPVWPRYGNNGKFTTEENNKCASINHNEGFFEYSNENNHVQIKNSYDLGSSNNFTICFWAKFKEELKNNLVSNHIIFCLDNETDKIDYQFTPDTNWHHYAFIRIKDTIRMYIDGELTDQITSDASFNLDNKSYIYIGNSIEHCLGDTLLLDDVYIFASQALWNTPSFAPPNRYMKTDIMYQLFKKVDHNVFGMTDDYNEFTE